MAAQREMRLVAGRNLRAIGKRLHAEAREALRLARRHGRRAVGRKEQVGPTEGNEAKTPLGRAFDRDAAILRQVAGHLIRTGRQPLKAVRETLAAWRSLREPPSSHLG